MRSFISLLLIPLVMLGQPLPHSHAGTNVVETSDHASRPHLHVASGHAPHKHADHNHTNHSQRNSSHWDGEHHHQHANSSVANTVAALSQSTEHDADAVYGAGTSCTVKRTPIRSDLSFVVIDRELVVPLAMNDASPYSRTSDPPDRYAKLPLFLLIASLRL